MDEVEEEKMDEVEEEDDVEEEDEVEKEEKVEKWSIWNGEGSPYLFIQDERQLSYSINLTKIIYILYNGMVE